MMSHFQRRMYALAATGLFGIGSAAIVVPAFLRADDNTETAKTEKASKFATTFIGEIAKAPESARVAVVVDGTSFLAYVCSSDQPFNDQFSRWFRGTIADGKLSGKAPCGAEFTASLSGETIAGRLKKGDESHEFTAKAIAPDANAGLFRAGESFGDDDYVIGWIIDEKDNVVGTGGRNGGRVQTINPPKGNNNLNPVVGDQKLQPQRATNNVNPKAPAPKGTQAKGPNPKGANTAGTGSPRKIDAAAKQEMLQDLVASRQASGGNVIQAMLLHQMRRFSAGRKAETQLEEKVFAILRKAPGNSIAEYLKDWEKIPVATRATILGPAAAQLDGNKGLDSAQVKALASAMPQVRAIRKDSGPAAAGGTVTGVTIPTVKCVDETNPERLGSDEIFAIHTVISGSGDPVVKRTGLLTEFDDGVQKNFAGGDATVFPLQGLSPAPGAEIYIVTTLYEDDGSGVIAVLNFLKPLIEASTVLIIDSFRDEDNKLNAVEKALVKLAVDGAISAVTGPLGNLLVQPLGTDAIVVNPNGTISNENGGNKTKMSFRKVKNGDVRYDYELLGFTVQRN
jgi:hypothetical protein